MKAVALVAHPDDCVIFAWPFIEAHPEFIWEIVYLTYRPNDPRARELTAYWTKRNVPVSFIGMRDNWDHVQKGELGFDSSTATKAVIDMAEPFDLILTHFEDGDYGHVHHMFVNAVAKQIDKPKVYFASTFNYNTKYEVIDPVSTDELPLHQEVIEQFTDRNTGRYIVTPEAELIIKKNK